MSQRQQQIYDFTIKTIVGGGVCIIAFFCSRIVAKADETHDNLIRIEERLIQFKDQQNVENTHVKRQIDRIDIRLNSMEEKMR